MSEKIQVISPKEWFAQELHMVKGLTKSLCTHTEPDINCIFNIHDFWGLCHICSGPSIYNTQVMSHTTICLLIFNFGLAFHYMHLHNRCFLVRKSTCSCRLQTGLFFWCSNVGRILYLSQVERPHSGPSLTLQECQESFPKKRQPILIYVHCSS